MKKTLTLLGLVGTVLLAACGSEGATGEKGADGPQGEPGGAPAATLAFVTPNKGILDRTVEVTISGTATKFSGTPSVDFGAGVTVSDVKVLSASAISAKLVVAPTAVLGPRAVKIDALSLPAGFTVVPAIATQLVGPAQQGGVGVVTFANQDPSTPFDKDALALVAPDLINLSISATSNIAAEGVFLVPPMAAATPSVALANVDAEGNSRASFFGAPGDVTIKTAQPTALTLNTPAATLNLGAQLATTYKKAVIPAGSPMIVDYRVEVAEDGNASPLGFLFGKGGTSKDLLGNMAPPASLFGPQPPPYDLHIVLPRASSAAAEDQYFVLFDSSGAGAPVTFTAVQVRAEAVAEVASAHATGPTSQNLGTLQALPANLASDVGGKIVTGALAASAEVDVYKLTVANNDSLQVAVSGDGEYDVVVTSDGTSDPQADTNLGYVYSAGKGQLGSGDVDVKTDTTVYVAIKPYSNGVGSYALSVRKLK